MTDPFPDTPALVAALTSWFASHARELPWRSDRTPYRVWVSEVMLQQTRVRTVVPYFERFVARFPDIHALAGADLEDVLKAWEGLGYYRRARLLHRAARTIVRDHGGRLPDSAIALRGLPGFGAYTAAAVAALAFGRPTLAVDGNVRRVGCRVLALPQPDDAAIHAALGGWPAMARDPGAVTEGLIELGARVCTPATPDCPSCPLRPGCRAAALGTPEAFPAYRARRAAPTRHRYAVVDRDDHGVWLEQRPVDGPLGGMWGVPQVEHAPTGETLGTVTHVYTHFRLELAVVAAPVPPLHLAGTIEKIAWDRIATLPLSGVDAKVLALLEAARSPADRVSNGL